MNDNVDLNVFQSLLSEFRREEMAARPTVHTPHGDAQAWRLAEETLAAGVVRGN